MKFRLALAGAALLCLVSGGTALADHRDGHAENPNQESGKHPDEKACVNNLTGQNEGTFSLEGVLSGWPPNHKPKDITFTLTDTDGDPLDGVTIEVTGAHDEVGLNGAGNPDNVDFAGGAGEGEGSASAGAWYLSERSGQGDGRTYTWTVTGTTDDGTATCEPVTYETYVVHDQGSGND